MCFECYYLRLALLKLATNTLGFLRFRFCTTSALTRGAAVAVRAMKGTLGNLDLSISSLV